MPIPFKPRSSAARDGLKQLKEGFDDPAFDGTELLVEWAAVHGPSQPVRAYSGEFLHQLALRSERRGNLERAERLYRMSAEQLRDNPLGLARTLRDHGMFIATYGDEPKNGVALIEEALLLHEQDVDNAKGHRQRRITESKLWRAHILCNDDEADVSRDKLARLALGPDFNFHVRDCKVIIDFLIPRTKGKVRQQLLAQKAAIHTERRQLKRAIESYLKLLIDVELSLAGAFVRQIFRRE